MIDDYLAQTAAWDRPVSVNAYNEPVYVTGTVRCRIEVSRTVTNTPTGPLVAFGTRVFTREAIETGDRIDGRLVIRVDIYRHVDGTVSHYVGYLQ